MTPKESHLQVIEATGQIGSGEIERGEVGLGERTDDQLMTLVTAGHRAAFSELLLRHEARVFGFAAKYLGDRALAEEVTQEAFVRLWRSRESYEPKGAFPSYVVGIALNACRELSRSRRRQNAALQRFARDRPPEQWDASAEQVLLRREAEVRVERMVAELPRRHREAVLLRFHGELSYREMADQLGRTEVALRSRVFHALRRLRSALSEEGP